MGGETIHQQVKMRRVAQNRELKSRGKEGRNGVGGRGELGEGGDKKCGMVGSEMRRQHRQGEEKEWIEEYEAKKRGI